MQVAQKVSHYQIIKKIVLKSSNEKIKIKIKEWIKRYNIIRWY